jgi:hypothetical protein
MYMRRSSSARLREQITIGFLWLWWTRAGEIDLCALVAE